jgi:ubiquinone/menaquinone biosynthesis C-methylase UbiE
MLHPELIPETGLLFNGDQELFVPPLLRGCRVLVLGCKNGSEAYTCSALVGPEGKVVGVDEEPSEIEKANKFLDFHAKQFGHEEPNIQFVTSSLSDLSWIEDNSVDVIVSATSINSKKEKLKILSEAWRILKEGGEIYFSDVLCNRRINVVGLDKHLRNRYNTIYLEDFRRLMNQARFDDVRFITREEVSESFQNCDPCNQFFLVTIRSFKISCLEDRLENYGQTATFLGTRNRNNWRTILFDDRNTFAKDCQIPVDGNTAEILTSSRYKPYFEVSPKGPHRGLFVSH